MKNLAMMDLPEYDYRLTKYANTGKFKRKKLHFSKDMADPDPNASKLSCLPNVRRRQRYRLCRPTGKSALTVGWHNMYRDVR